MDKETLFASVYRTSFEWACLGGEVRETPWGKAVYNSAQPDYHEANGAWYFDPGSDFDAAIKGLKRYHVAVGNRCYNWTPVEDTVAVKIGFRDRGYVSQPATALVRRLNRRSSIPEQFTALPAGDHKDRLAKVFELNGQRWRGEASLNRAMWVLEHSTYEGFVCLWGGEIVARVGLLKTAGKMARLKSVFVGGDTRNRGLGQVVIDHIANRAIELGYSWLASEVDEDNAASQRCHQKAGFRPVGKINCYRIATYD